MDKTTVVLIASGILLGMLFLIPRRSKASPVNDQEFSDFTPNANAPRGIQNNNPGNIEDAGIPWRGRVGNDGRYVIFDSAVNGIRAMARDINMGFVRDGEDTVREIISEWAPSNENDTAAYISAVAKFIGVGPDDAIEYRLYIKPLLRAIIRHENGYDPYPDSVIDRALLESGTL